MTKLVDAQAMLEAAASGDLALLTRELERGVSLFSQNLSGHNALFLALYQNQEDLALVLIGRMAEADPDLGWLTQTDKSNGFNVLHVAVANRKLRALSALLAIQKNPFKGLVIPSTKGNEDTPVHLAAREDMTKALALVLKACPEGLTLMDASGRYTPLSTAIGADKLDATALLLKEGAEVTTAGSTLLPPWSFVRSVAMTNLLAEHLDWPSVRTSEGGHVLHVLANRGKGLRLSLLKSMVSRPGCKELIGLADNRQRTALHSAVATNADPEVIDFLVSKGALWCTPDDEGVSPLNVLEQQLAGGWQVDEEAVRMWRAKAKQQRMEEVYAQSTTEKHAPRL